MILPPDVNGSASPSAVRVNDTTFVFYKGVVGDSRIWMTRNGGAPHLGTWTPTVRLPNFVTTNDAPSAVTIGSAIYVVYRSSGDSRVWIARTFDRGQSWSATRLAAEVNTGTRPEAFVSGSALYVVYKGPGGDERLYVTSVTSDRYWQPI